jgi:predicted ATPase
MRIDKLAIKSPWKNLSGFKVDFDETRDVAVLIGRNGSAKSNLLEALIRIFRDIDFNAPSPFAYEIDYRLKERFVHVEAEVEKCAKTYVDGKPVSTSDLRANWIPRYVVGYYSGTSDRFEGLYQKHDKLALKETLKNSKHGETLTFRRFVCARPVHGLFALLAFYLSDDKEIGHFLAEYPKIESFDSVLLILHKPEWSKKGSSQDEFWGAKGPVRELLEAFRRQSLAPFTRTVTVPRGFRRRETRELMYLYLPDLNSLHALAAEYGRDPRTFFQALDTMRLSELISDFRVRVRVKGSPDPIHTRELSEGEQQLLTVLGLMRFTRDEESLYLLDEPDTHLNPAWGLEYLDRLRKVGGIDKNSHTIIATHDPLLVAGLLKQEIRVLYRSEEGKIVAAEPEESPRGTGVAGVLTSQLYGLESQLDQFSLKVLKRIYEISIRKDYPMRQRHLDRLRRLVPGLTPTEYSPDPYRSIAKLAFEMAIDRVVKSENNQDSKRNAVENLSSRLYKETGVKKG